ncbi:MAG: serine/threonine-protein kinase [Planctomycetia bacterium]|nr:serine/threonine-protein kinase [Planctomycetia bacterium]
MNPGRYASLAAGGSEAEPFVRQSFQLLEADFRQFALAALADWQRHELAADELFPAVAALQRPSWGSWNGLVAALREARKNILRGGEQAQRTKLEAAATLRGVLDLFDERLADDTVAALEALARLTRTTVPARPRVAFLLTLPIALRNRVVHDMPTEPSWWNAAAAAMRPIVDYHAAHELGTKLIAEAGYPEPWFLLQNDKPWAFNGIERDSSVIYVSPTGESLFSAERTSAVMQAFAGLLGKTETQETDFRRLISQSAPEDVRGVLMGDFLVGRPAGAGGFATVHVGRQLSTGRKVAVKILHDGMPEEAKLRFQHEARVLSQLKHPHVVVVYGSGEESWSAPRAFSLSDEPWFQKFSKTAPVKSYIAMEWIAGKTVDDFIRASGGDQPSERTVAEWFRQAASALGAAHLTGIVHRDVKPSNLMVTDEGQIKLMDFGIARSQSEAGALMTATGQGLGTPAYMSPEQIRASDAEGEVGPATDIYSLCATFYELFTKRRLYDHDSESPETIRTSKLQGRPPQLPRAHVRGLPWELEAILLGGLEHEIADRYRSMADLERDLTRYLHDEPIEYRRPSFLRRMQLAYRRNRAVANVVAGALLLLVAGTGMYVRDLSIERAKAEESFRNARGAVDELFTRVSEETLLNEPGMQELRKDLLRKTQSYYRKFLQQRADDEALEDELAVTYFREGRILEELETPANALPSLLEAKRRQANLLSATPNDLQRLQALGDTSNAIGRAQQTLGKFDEASAAYQEAIGVRKRLADAEPTNHEYRRTLANTHMNVGMIEQKRGRYAEAGAAFDTAQNIRRSQPADGKAAEKIERDMAMGYYNQALLDVGQDRTADAERNFGEALKLLKTCAAREPRDLSLRRLSAICHRLLGDLKQFQSQPDQARVHYSEARDILTRLVDLSPDVSEYRAELAGVLMNGSSVDPATSAAALEQARVILDRLVASHPDDSRFRRDLAAALRALAASQRQAGEVEQAKAGLELSLQHLTRLTQSHPDNVEFSDELAKTRTALAELKAGSAGTPK